MMMSCLHHVNVKPTMMTSCLCGVQTMQTPMTSCHVSQMCDEWNVNPDDVILMWFTLYANPNSIMSGMDDPDSGLSDLPETDLASQRTPSLAL